MSDRRQQQPPRRREDFDRELEIEHWRGSVEATLEGIDRRLAEFSEQLVQLRDLLHTITLRVQQAETSSTRTYQESRQVRYGLYTLAFGSVGLTATFVLGHLG